MVKNKKLACCLLGAGLVIGLTGVLCRNSMRRQQKEIKKWKDSSDKYSLYTNIFSEWIRKKQDGICLADYLEKRELKRVAIYGIGFIGERLYDELKNSSIEVVYAIDQNPDMVWSDLEVYSPGEKLPKVDAIIVTPLYYFETIRKSLEGKIDGLIISLEDILCER